MSFMAPYHPPSMYDSPKRSASTSTSTSASLPPSRKPSIATTSATGTGTSSNNGSSGSRPGTPSAGGGGSGETFVPVRLANFGRKISQMRDDFMADLDGVEPRRGSLDSSRTAVEEAVPGMGDEPVMCPFCNKPLPPALFIQHSSTNHHHQTTPQKRGTPVRPSMRQRPATSIGVAASFGSNSPSKGSDLDTPMKSPLRNERLLEPLPVDSPAAQVTVPLAAAETLRPKVDEGDDLNHTAAACSISDEDLRRWSKVAGLPFSRTTSASKLDTPAQADKVERPATNERGSGRFNFFRRNSSRSRAEEAGSDGSDSDDATGATGMGYAKILGPGTDDEDEEEGNEDKGSPLHDEPKGMKNPDVKVEDTAESIESADVPKIEEPPKDPAADPEELKSVLKEVLAKVNEISSSHAALLASQSTLLTSLKIARSNLVMAEANTEMLEAQLKQAKAATATPTTASRSVSTPGPDASSSAAYPSTAPTAAGSGRTSVDSKKTPPALSRSSTERPRPSSLQMPPPEGPNGERSASGTNGGWGFWNGSKKRIADRFESLSSSLPTPTGEGPAYNYSQSSGSRPTTPFAAGSPGAAAFSAARPALSRSNTEVQKTRTPKSASVDDLSSAPDSAEATRLRQAYAKAEERMDSMTKELAELKKGKVEMEQELENLSQALFEEANKMVADERRKRAEMEEALKEVKAEKEALRQTIKVLGGGGESDTASDADAAAQEGGGGRGQPKGDEDDEGGSVAAGEPEFDPASFQPRDLDKHYEALRKSIHHVADGTGVELSPAALPSVPETRAQAQTSPHSPSTTTKPLASNDAALTYADDDDADTTKVEAQVASTIPDVKPIASNPDLEGSVDVPMTIPEQSPLPALTLPADPNPWDEPSGSTSSSTRLTGTTGTATTAGIGSEGRGETKVKEGWEDEMKMPE